MEEACRSFSASSYGLLHVSMCLQPKNFKGSSTKKGGFGTIGTTIAPLPEYAAIVRERGVGALCVRVVSYRAQGNAMWLPQ